MTERMTLRIVPLEGGDGVLTVEDAMVQVLDTFRLLNAEGGNVVWRLVSASTNSPLTIVAEADNSLEATTQVETFTRSLEELALGRFPEAWKRPELALPASAFLQASTRLARTEYLIGDRPQINLDAKDAEAFAKDIVEYLPVPTLALPVYQMPAKVQFGSIDCILLQAITYHSKPAVRVKERKTRREITCIISEELAKVFSSHASVNDIWKKRRVTVRGKIHYAMDGSILRIEASGIEPVMRAEISASQLRDPNFTSGLTAAEYLEKFRAGELG